MPSESDARVSANSWGQRGTRPARAASVRPCGKGAVRDGATVKFRNRTAGLLERGWIPITVATLVSHLSVDPS
jgi:hypothetical protein